MRGTYALGARMKVPRERARRWSEKRFFGNNRKSARGIPR